MWLDKGVFPENCILCVRVKINNRSFEPFCVWIQFPMSWSPVLWDRNSRRKATHHSLSHKLMYMYCSGHAVVKGNDRADRVTGKASVTSGHASRKIRSVAELEILPAVCPQNQGHHTIDGLEERGVERGSAGCSSLKGRERAIVSQTNIRINSKATLEKTAEYT